MSTLRLLREISHTLPELLLLGVYTHPERSCRWLYSFQNQDFLADPSLQAALAGKPREGFDVQHTHYTETLSCQVRSADAVIVALCGRSTTNARLLEYVLRQHGPQLAALRSDPPSSAAPVPPGYALLKALTQRPGGHTFQLQAKAGGGKYLLRQLQTASALWSVWAPSCADPDGAADYHMLNAAPAAETHLLRPWMPGVSLRTLVTRLGKIPLNQSVALLEKIAQQLAPFHAADRGHLNLHPNNILINSQREVRLVDSGLSQLNGQDADLAGAPLFMAPEQHASGSVSPAADFYALGVLWLYMLCGDAALAALPAHTVTAQRDALHSLAHAELNQRAQLRMRPLLLDLLSLTETTRTAGFLKLTEALKTQAVQV
ncbi:MAG: protein kinase domain-containing protein [Candidatus Sericytochromatia bacterium]